MKSRLLLSLSLITACVFLNSCVTTTTSSYENKKDLAKAEETYIQIGYGYFEQQNFLESKRALIKAIDLNDRSAGAHMGLARVYERELEFDLANDHFQKAIRYGDSSEVRFQYGVYLYNRGDLEGAFEHFDETLSDTVYLRRPQAFEFQGVVASRLGRETVAINHYERAIALNPSMSNSYLALTRIFNERGEYPRAYTYFKGYVNLVRAQIVRHNAATLWMGIQLANEVSDDDLAASLSLALRNRFPDSTEYQRYLAWKQGA